MKLVTYANSGAVQQCVGIVIGDSIYDLKSFIDALDPERRTEYSTVLSSLSNPCVSPMLGLLQNWDQVYPALNTLAAGGNVPGAAPVASPIILAPVPQPTSMRDGYAFRQHVEAARRNRGVPMIEEFDHFPVFYFTNHLAVSGPGMVRVRDEHLDRLDFELECAIVIGREGRDIPASQADDYIAGYMVMNDWSARRLQMDEMKLNLGPAKGKDFATSIGPYLVTRDELNQRRIVGAHGERYDLAMRASVNGTEVSRGNLKDMTWTFAQIIERASYGVTLYPGDVIGSGTVGTGCFLELNGSGITDNWWLREGDSVVCEIEMLGELENSIAVYQP